MRHPQVLVFESDGRLTEMLRGLAEARRWTLQQTRRAEACLDALGRGPSVLVIRVGRDLARELTLLERAAWLRPDAATVAVGDTDDGVLAGLAWDLGASYVVFPPQTRDVLPDLVAGLMAAALARKAPWQTEAEGGGVAGP
jgi:hypothetical protein